MKKIIILILTLACVFNMASCLDEYGAEIEITVSYAGWSDDKLVSDNALNKDKLQIESEKHLPVFLVDTALELEEFKTRYGDALSMDKDYGEFLSLEKSIEKAKYGNRFFDSYSLLIIYVPANNSSLRFGINDIDLDSDSVCIHLYGEEDPEDTANGKAGWLFTLSFYDYYINDCTSIDAILDDSKNNS